MQTNEQNYIFDEDMRVTKYGWKIILRVTLIGLLILILLLTGCAWFFTVKSTERAVVSQWWAVNRKAWEWLHFKVPLMETVKIYSIVPQQMSMRIPVWDAWAITKDNQTIWVDMTIFYRYDDEDIINIAKNYGTKVLEENLKQNVTKAFKESVGKLTIFDVAEKQNELNTSTLELAKKYVNNYPVTIDDIQITNYDWSAEFDKQIQETMKIAQEAKQQEQNLKKIEIEAQQQVKQAEAEKQAKIIKAEAEKEAQQLQAEALRIKWEWEKAYNDLITAKTVNMEYQIKMRELDIEEQRVKNWDGHYVSTNNYWPIPVASSTLQWR